MKTIKIFCNYVAGGWSPKDLKTGVGGSEEMLIMLTEKLASKYDITVYQNGFEGTRKGVKYMKHEDYKSFEHCDNFISFKAKRVFDLSISADKKIHWSHEIEEPVECDHFVCLSKFHANECGITDSKELEIIPNFIDFEDFKQAYRRVPDIMLYSSSFDRGLETLLNDWHKIESNSHITLYITYGWDVWDSINKNNIDAMKWKKRMQRLMKQKGIKYLGRVSKKQMNGLYKKARYWVLPLNNPQGELFCINAIKAQHCNTIPIVIKEGALKETVKECILYDDFLKNPKTPFNTKNNRIFSNLFDINEVIKRWNKILI